MLKKGSPEGRSPFGGGLGVSPISLLFPIPGRKGAGGWSKQVAENIIRVLNAEPSADSSMNLDNDLDSLKDELVSLRRELHQHPELAFKEDWTSRRIAQELEAASLEVQRGVGGTGVVGLLRGSRPGRTCALRADIDGLPILEETSTHYRSQNPGAMHACGHDGHTAVAITIAKALSHIREELPGTMMFIFQPAEEIAEGAKTMIEAGALASPKVDGIVGFHLWNSLPVGTIGVRTGPLFAGVDVLELTIRGKGGHGATPHLTVDPINISAHLLVALQSLLSREKDPRQPLVLTFGTIHAGTAFNVIPDEARITGTMRAFDRALRDRMLQRIEELAKGIARAMGGDCTLELKHPCPPVVNDMQMSQAVKGHGMELLGPKAVLEPEPIMIADDMSYFLDRVPGCYFLVGSGNQAKGFSASHHSSHFDFDEDALLIAAKVVARTLLGVLGKTT